MRILLAPLRGVTLAPFRRTLSLRFGGLDGALAPFAALGGPGRVPAKIFADVAADARGEFPVEPQVIGRDPDSLREAGRILRDMGFSRMNLNCGCPWKFVARKGRGSGLPEDPVAFERMLEAGCEAMPGGFSVKIRLGRHSPRTLEERAEMLNRHPLRCIVVHPRTADQMYGGRVDLDAFGRVLPMLRAPVIYNGDIFSADDAVAIAARFPSISGIMIGRGLCMRPWLAEEIAARLSGKPLLPSPEREAENRARAFHFAEALAEQYSRQLFGPAPLLGRLKELWSYLHAAFEGGDEGLRRILRSTTPEALLAAVRSLAAGAGVDVTQPRFARGGELRECSSDGTDGAQQR